MDYYFYGIDYKRFNNIKHYRFRVKFVTLFISLLPICIIDHLIVFFFILFSRSSLFNKVNSIVLTTLVHSFIIDFERCPLHPASVAFVFVTY
jgi:hypothetical protein